MKYDKIAEAYVGILTEMPNLSPYHPHDAYADLMSVVRKVYKPVVAGKDHYIGKTPSGDTVAYHRDGNGNIHSASLFYHEDGDNVIHSLTSKMGAPDATGIYQNIQLMVDEGKNVLSDENQTRGGRSLWMNIHKHVKHGGLSVIDNSTGEEKSVKDFTDYKDNDDPDIIFKIHGNRNWLKESTEHPMIEVDGVMKHRNNSEGNPIHPTDEGIRNFHRWAGDDEMKDSEGRPMVMYHGTSKDVDYSDFKVPKNGVWLTTSKKHASDYAKQNDSQDTKYDPDTRRFVDINTASRVLPLYIKGKSEYKMTEDDHKKINTSNYKKSQGMLFDTLRGKGHDLISHGGGTYTVIGGKDQFKSAIGNIGNFSTKKTKIHESDDYRDSHTAPGPDAAPAHALNSNGIYPDDIYSSKGASYYGDGRDDDKLVLAQLKTLKDRPNASIDIYRAVPKKHKDDGINAGDWVTTSKQYAIDHGEGRLNGDYAILKKTVKASEIHTDGNSYHEFGYNPHKKESIEESYKRMATQK